MELKRLKYSVIEIFVVTLQKTCRKLDDTVCLELQSKSIENYEKIKIESTFLQFLIIFVAES